MSFTGRMAHNAAVIISLFAFIIACGGGGGSDVQDNTATTSADTQSVEKRTLNGTLIDEESEAVSFGTHEATHQLSDINRVRAIDENGDTYLAEVTDGSFSIELPIGLSYVITFMVNNEFVAVLAYQGKNWFKMQSNPGNHLALGRIRLNLISRLAECENDPWEGEYNDEPSPWDDENDDNIPDTIFDSTLPSIDIIELDYGTAGYGYSADMTVSGGASPYEWSISKGSLPDGLKIDSSTGRIYGIASKDGDYTFTVRVSDSNGSLDEHEFAIKVYRLPGTKVWDFDTDGDVPCPPAVANGYLYIGSKDNKLYCFEAKTGEWIWEYQTEGWVFSGPAISGGYAYFGSYDKSLYCVDAFTGKKKWSFATGGEVVSSPAVVDGKVYFGSYDGILYCLSADTGAEEWRYVTGGLVASAPAVSGGKVYFGSNDTNIYCLDAATGDKIWNYMTGSYVYSSATLTNGKVFIGGLDKKLYCLDATTGAKVWDFATGAQINSTPVVDNDMVFIGSTDFKFYCLNISDGSEKWSFDTGKKIFACPAVANGYVYLGTEGYVIYCFKAETGEKQWEYATGNMIRWASPALVDGYLYLGSYDSRIYCITAPESLGDSWPTFQHDNARTGSK